MKKIKSDKNDKVADKKENLLEYVQQKTKGKTKKKNS
jgi:hypothetical protein